MKLIIAIIRSENLGRVEAALNQGKVCLLSVSQVLGSGWEPGYKESYRGREIKMRQQKVRLEMAVQDMHADAAVEAIVRAESTDDPRRAAESGIFVLDLNDAVRMRNGEPVPEACGS